MAATIWVVAARHQNQQVLSRFRGEYLELKSKADTVNDIKSRRVEFFRIQSFLNSPSRVAFTAATFIRKLGSVDSSRLLFSELKLVPGNQTIFFRIKAFIQSGEKSKQTDIAEVFCRQLKGWNEIFDVSWSLENSKNSESTLPVLIVSGKVELE